MSKQIRADLALQQLLNSHFLVVDQNDPSVIPAQNLVLIDSLESPASDWSKWMLNRWTYLRFANINN